MQQLFTSCEISMRIYSMLLLLSLVLFSTPILAQFDGGNGTAANPYLISTLTQLNEIRNAANNAHFKLTANINATPTAGWNSGAGWLPISYFNGTLDGDGFTITGFTIQRPGTNGVGFFTQIGADASIKNINFIQVQISGSENSGIIAGIANSGSFIQSIQAAGSVSGSNNTGGITGTLQGSIHGSAFQGTVSGTGNSIGGIAGFVNNGQISNSNSDGTVTGNHDVGGLVGFNGYGGTAISNSHSKAAVSGDQRVGGLVGSNTWNTTIFNSWASGPVNGSSETGGLVGNNTGTLTRCHASGSVTASGNIAGGLVGRSDEGNIDNCYAVGSVNGNNFVGGLVGRLGGTSVTQSFSSGSVAPGGGNRGGLIGFSQNSSVSNSFWDTQTSGMNNSAGGTARTTAQMKTLSTFTSVGWNFTNIWVLDPALNNGYPHLSGQLQPPGFTWTGNTDHRWHIAGNWNNNNVPGTNDQVTIPNTTIKPIIVQGYVEVAQLTIELNASITINPGTGLKVSQTIVNQNGQNGIVIVSDATGTGSLIHFNNSIAATFQRYIPGEPEAWHLLSSPVAGHAISPEFTPSGTYADGTGYDMFAWHEPDTQWVFYMQTGTSPDWNTVNSGDNFVTGKGYLVAYQAANPTFSFKGNLHQGNISVPVTRTAGTESELGYNLMGNPYPSSIDWKAAIGWERSMLENDNGGYYMWIWNDEAYNYGTYHSASASQTGTLGVTRYIAPTQGFFVKANSTGQLTMNNDVRVHDDAGNWLKPSGALHQISLKVSADGAPGFDQVNIEFGHHAESRGAEKKFSFIAHAPSLFIPALGRQYSIRFLSSTEKTPVVPLVFTPGKEGQHTITADFDPDLFDYLMLEDIQTRVMYNLKQNPEYTFTARPSDAADRFVLHFREGNFANPHLPLPALIYGHNQTLFADMTLMDESARLTMYDLSGRKLYQATLEPGVTHQLQFAISGVFIAKLSNHRGRLVEKVFF